MQGCQSFGSSAGFAFVWSLGRCSDGSYCEFLCRRAFSFLILDGEEDEVCRGKKPRGRRR